MIRYESSGIFHLYRFSLRICRSIALEIGGNQETKFAQLGLIQRSDSIVSRFTAVVKQFSGVDLRNPEN